MKVTTSAHRVPGPDHLAGNPKYRVLPDILNIMNYMDAYSEFLQWCFTTTHMLKLSSLVKMQENASFYRAF